MKTTFFSAIFFTVFRSVPNTNHHNVTKYCLYAVKLHLENISTYLCSQKYHLVCIYYVFVSPQYFLTTLPPILTSIIIRVAESCISVLSATGYCSIITPMVSLEAEWLML